MRILVHPHSMELGGSQLNAVDLAGALQRAGHEVVVFGDDGDLTARVDHWGLEHVVARPPRSSPDLGRARQLLELARRREIQVLHGWEWPPVLECWTAASAAGGGVRAVGSVMSMSVAPFLPTTVPLTVGTEHIRRDAARARTGRSAAVTLLEPPVDLDDNAPGGHLDPQLVRSADEIRIAIVSRLVPELKLEGVLTAVRAVGELAARFPCRLVIAGDGSAYGDVRAAAASVNQEVGREVVTLLGAVDDPRPVYDTAHVCLGMGGSALRSLAFAKPLVVQGEGGFFCTLDPESVDQFLLRGWYGLDRLGPEQAVDRLVSELVPLLADPARRATLGTFGRGLVADRFSLEAGVRVLETVYEDALASPGRSTSTAVEVARCGWGLVSHKASRRRRRRRGSVAVDDFNARPV